MINKILLGIALALGLLGSFLGIVHNTGPSKAYGDTQTNPSWYSGGIAWGAVDLQNNTAQIVIPSGQNQGNWGNSLGRDLIVDSADVSINGTASSTFKVYVGTSTAATVADSFLPAVAPFWSQLIDAFQVSTSTGAQAGASSAYLTDNISSHKSSYPSKLQVPPGENVHVQFDSFCLATGACETATSTNRGFSNMTVTFYYHYKGSD